MFPIFQMSFHGMDPSPSVETQARDLAGRLEQFSDRISAIRVTVDPVHQRPRQGIIYRIRIEISAPGNRVVVNREPALDHAHEDIHAAIHDAFDVARRQLQDNGRHQARRGRLQAPPARGRIVRVFADRGYAFIADETGGEIYVHQNCVLGSGFARLKVGDPVRYLLDAEDGEQGPQARAVFPRAVAH